MPQWLLLQMGVPFYAVISILAEGSVPSVSVRQDDAQRIASSGSLGLAYMDG